MCPPHAPNDGNTNIEPGDNIFNPNVIINGPSFNPKIENPVAAIGSKWLDKVIITFGPCVFEFSLNSFRLAYTTGWI